jgi:glycosyltransferase involved in cell wall biosynthesis
MNLLIAHEFYQRPGGEDKAFHSTCEVFQKLGHQVIPFCVANDEITTMPRLDLLRKTIWNGNIANTIHETCKRERIDVAIFHNTFPLLSPAVYGAAKAAGAKTVQWLHNYRLLCPAATFYRDGKLCEDCLGKIIPYDAVVHRCYRGSLTASSVTAAMIGFHNMRKTWINEVDRFVVLTDFAKEKFLLGGLPADKLTVVPNFLTVDSGIGDGSGDYAIFVGRLTPEKGIQTMLDAWEDIDLPLKVVGDGPMRQQVMASSVDYLGQRDYATTIDLIKRAKFLVFPSEWFEVMSYTMIEALCAGTPVLSSTVGKSKLITDGETGFFFETGNKVSLREKATAIMNSCAAMRPAVRASFEPFNPEHGERRLAALLNHLGH